MIDDDEEEAADRRRRGIRAVVLGTGALACTAAYALAAPALWLLPNPTVDEAQMLGVALVGVGALGPAYALGAGLRAMAADPTGWPRPVGAALAGVSAFALLLLAWLGYAVGSWQGLQIVGF